MQRPLIVLSLLVLAGSPAHAQNVEAGQSVFKQACGICHDVTAGKNRIGPSLFGIVGRPAGIVPNFHYSDGNKNSGMTWSADVLNKYLVNPRATVPGTTMSYAGLKDDQKRLDLIAYLTTLH